MCNIVNNTKIAFLISSVVETSNKPFSFKSKRTDLSYEERIKYTKDGIKRIHEMLPNATIFLIEASIRDHKDKFELDSTPYVHYFYIGNKHKVRKDVDSQYILMGERRIIIEGLKIIKGFDYIFKVSGKYYPNKNFDLTKFLIKKPCFQVRNTNARIAKKSYNLTFYSIPSRYVNKYKVALFFSSILVRYSMEQALPILFHKDIVNVEHLGVSGITSQGNLYTSD